MTEWREVKLGDVADVIGGGTPSTKNYDFWNGDISWLTPKDLSGYKERYISKGERNITASGLQNSSARILPKGTVLLTSRAPIGYLAIAKQEVCTNQGFKSIVLKNGYLPEFFYYLLKNNIEYIIGMSSGSTFSEISGTQVKNLEFKVPPLDVQTKIAGVLGALDDKIELNNKINQNLEAQAQALFKSWFIDFSPFGGKMPNDWKIGKLSDIAEYSNDTISTEFTSFENYISTENMLPNRGGISRASSLPTGNTVKSYRTTDVLISNIRPYFKKIWFALFSGGCSNDILVFRSKKDSPAFVFNVLNQDDFFEYVMSGANGSKMPRGDKKHIMQYKVIIPSAKTIKEFENIAITFLEKFSNNNQENVRLAELRDTLLPKLMNGEIDVDNVKID